VSRTLCLIPARGGSKGIPRKNLRQVGGKPLIVWTIEQALAIEDDGQVDVVVSTDDQEIADVALAAGAAVPFLRPAELAEDTTATEPVVLHAIEQLSASGSRPDTVMLLQATSPLRHSGTLTRALAEFRESGADSMVGVVPQAPFLWWASDPPRADYDVGRRPRRQDLTPELLRYRETGSVYVTRTEIYLEHHNRLGGRVGLFVMDELEGVDIDTHHDLAFAEQQLRLLA
jgi:CMP-N,N'-diacetyllegionaminic acid synthase